MRPLILEGGTTNSGVGPLSALNAVGFLGVPLGAIRILILDFIKQNLLILQYLGLVVP